MPKIIALIVIFVAALLIAGMIRGHLSPVLTQTATTTPQTATTTAKKTLPATTTKTTPPPSPIAQKKGTISGNVSLGPICPVERIPPDPKCADKPYQTSIRIQKGSVLYTTAQSNSAGQFTVSLAPGVYTFTAVGGNSVPPTCRPEQVTVTADQSQSITLYCDTGIR